MAVMYRRWDADDRVSAQWFTVLDAARKAGVSFFVTDGHRTMAEQQRLWDLSQHGGALAAFPSPTAPHIREGRPDHAIDVNALDGGATRLAKWLRRNGAGATFPVPGEPWHIEVPRDDLVRLARKVSDPFAGFTDKERRWIVSYDRLVKQKRDGRDTAEASERRVRLRALMTRRRKAIWHAAQESGWDRLHRRARYQALKSRTFRYEQHPC
jgi:hypothetical protein